jgi:hypothetical protein
LLLSLSEVQRLAQVHDAQRQHQVVHTHDLNVGQHSRLLVKQRHENHSKPHEKDEKICNGDSDSHVQVKPCAAYILCI